MNSKKNLRRSLSKKSQVDFETRVLEKLVQLHDENVSLRHRLSVVDIRYKECNESRVRVFKEMQQANEIISNLREYLTPRSRSKRRYVRRCDARNILKRLNTNAS